MQARLVIATCGDPGTFDQGGKVGGGAADDVVQKRERLGVCFRIVQALEFVGKSEFRAQAFRVQFHGVPQADNRLIQLAARRLHPGGEQHDVAVIRRKRQGSVDRRRRSFELPESQLRQSQIGPRGRFLRDDGGRFRELLPGIVQKADFEGRQPPIKRPSHLLVRLRSRRGKGGTEPSQREERG